MNKVKKSVKGSLISREGTEQSTLSRKFVFVLRNAWRPNSVVIRGVTIGSIISRGLTEGEGELKDTFNDPLPYPNTPHSDFVFLRFEKQHPSQG